MDLSNEDKTKFIERIEYARIKLINGLNTMRSANNSTGEELIIQADERFFDALMDQAKSREEQKNGMKSNKNNVNYKQEAYKK